MKTKFFLVSILLTMAVCSGCALFYKDISDIPKPELLLLNRIKQFQSTISSNDYETSWDMRSKSFKDIFTKSDYIDFLKGDVYFTGFDKIEYSVIYLDIRENRAKVKIQHKLSEKNGDKEKETDTYNYWIFERGNWYLAESSLTSTKADWW